MVPVKEVEAQIAVDLREQTKSPLLFAPSSSSKITFIPERDQYVSALKRYVPKLMSELFSERHKFGTWRRVWVALAEAQHKMRIYDAQGHERFGKICANCWQRCVNLHLTIKISQL